MTYQILHGNNLDILPIIEGRLKHAERIVAEAKEQDKAKESEKLF